MTDRPETFGEKVSSVLRDVLAVHFAPDSGTPYWLQKQRELGLDACRDIRTLEDLALLGPMDESALACRPIEDFIPRSLLHRRSEFIVAQTAGTLGRPKFAVHLRQEFEAAFVEPFLVAARRVGFPRELNWLFIGPSGPHIIGKAARRCAEATGSADPFTIDLDPRWAKKLPPGSFALQRYLEHVQDQALAVLDTQEVGIIFSTPAVLDGLSRQASESVRLGIRGVHLGGMSVSSAQRKAYEESFPNAVVLSGYGNTLFGMMPELGWSSDSGIDYYPHGLRVFARVVPEGLDDPADRLGQELPYGQRGQVVVHRLDHTQFIPNMMERDSAIRIRPHPGASLEGFLLDGLRDPQPIVNQAVKPTLGLY